MNDVQQLRGLLLSFLAETDLPVDDEIFLLDQRKRYRSERVLVVQPDSVEKIQELVRFCGQYGVKITVQGGNTGLVGGAVAKGGILLNLGRLNAIREINLADQSITVEAGCVLQTVQDAAKKVGRLFPLSLASEGSCQIGGNIACNAGGLNVLRYGTMRDLVLGLEVVLPDGSLLSHLQPLHKNTTGYDLKHLFIGSEGTLGVITAATLKLFAPALSSATAWVGVESVDEAVHLLTLMGGRFAERLCSFELMSDVALSLSAQFCGLAKPIENSQWHILLELSDSLLRDDLDDLLAEYLFHEGFGCAVLAQSEQERLDFWRLRESISAAQRHLGVSIKHDIALPIQRVANFVADCERDLLAEFADMQIVLFGHLGDGSLHYNTFLQDKTSLAYACEHRVNEIVYRHVLANGGTIAAEHGVGLLKKHWLPMVRTEAELMLMRAIKAQLDPHGLFNADKLFPERVMLDDFQAA